MPREDNTESTIGACPCGNGELVSVHYDLDHGYGAGTVIDEIRCSKCKMEWRVEGNHLIQLASEKQLHALENEQADLVKEVNSIGRPLVGTYFAERAYRYKTQELKELERLHLGGGSIDQYRKERAKRSIAAISHPAGNVDFVLDRCDASKRMRVREIVQRLKQLRAEVVGAKRVVVKRPLRRKGD
jgi:hypothetical protein